MLATFSGEIDRIKQCQGKLQNLQTKLQWHIAIRTYQCGTSDHAYAILLVRADGHQIEQYKEKAVTMPVVTAIPINTLPRTQPRLLLLPNPIQR